MSQPILTHVTNVVTDRQTGVILFVLLVLFEVRNPKNEVTMASRHCCIFGTMKLIKYIGRMDCRDGTVRTATRTDATTGQRC